MDSHILLNQIIEILHAYHDQHHDDYDAQEWLDARQPGDFDGMYGVEYEWPYLQGWWMLDTTGGWPWWFLVYSKDPAGQDLERFPFCDLDAPLPNADLSRLGVPA
jgi:hypothetical protein